MNTSDDTSADTSSQQTSDGTSDDSSTSSSMTSASTPTSLEEVTMTAPPPGGNACLGSTVVGAEAVHRRGARSSTSSRHSASGRSR